MNFAILYYVYHCHIKVIYVLSTGFSRIMWIKYVCIFLLPMSARHIKSSFVDAMIVKEVYQDIQSSGGKFEVICVPTHAKAQLDMFSDDYYNPL